MITVVALTTATAGRPSSSKASRIRNCGMHCTLGPHQRLYQTIRPANVKLTPLADAVRGAARPDGSDEGVGGRAASYRGVDRVVDGGEWSLGCSRTAGNEQGRSGSIASSVRPARP